MTFNTVKRCVLVRLCVFAIFLDILLQKVKALLSFVFVDFVPEIKTNLSDATVLKDLEESFTCRGQSLCFTALVLFVEKNQSTL